MGLNRSRCSVHAVVRFGENHRVSADGLLGACPKTALSLLSADEDRRPEGVTEEPALCDLAHTDGE
jgi:hypothetical protein